MENKEFTFNGFRMSGFIGLAIFFVLLAIFVFAGIYLALNVAEWYLGIVIPVGAILLILCLCGFMMLEPNEARALVFFGKYNGTFYETGFWWVNPFYSKKKVLLRARNLNADAIKVNDKAGNPIMIGLVVVWKVNNVYKALFDIDSQTTPISMTMKKSNSSKGSDIDVVDNLTSRMNAFENFVRVQSDAALRQTAGRYAYDDDASGAPTLRSGANEINDFLKETINERLSIAGIEAVEARINYLAYAPEIAAVMLRRQQADAIITAREKIVEGAVSMVKMALDKLSAEEVVELDDERKAAMVSNLLVVLCGDESAQPVLNTGSLYN